ncbi:GNAT family N-acetyltransferase [Catenuloplanes indicus]|uniref:Ribosomal protein S18 acetylase RimI-like enzyme n=1 Tax=Catenuloplanes indicus TaxID=137267 RepID=A0AAE3VWJ9_9ACTN|nr:GNAT family N-acetyltransferase [Catenuloplanes indicus]MDQ0364559.1 ribosomal protein S18 acetylase RimI-like enzyme [Catenuloplanes indicus]
MLATYTLRTAEVADVPGARRVMLDTLYRDMRSGYVPRWHGDVIDIAGAYLEPPRHTLLVATAPDGAVVATGGVRSHGPSAPDWLAQRYPAGITAQLCRVYVDPAHRRRGLARAMVDRLLAFIAADGGYTAAYLHTDPISPGAEAFWTAHARLVHDERPTPHGPGTVHFELEIPVRG